MTRDHLHPCKAFIGLSGDPLSSNDADRMLRGKVAEWST